MKITLEEMKEIAKRLPIGYYLGMKIPVTVEPDGGAYCDVVKGEIHIGLPILQQAADNIDATDAAKWDREALLRCVLYHEVGHLLLTPKWLKMRVGVRKADGDNDPDSSMLVNIFEDERLEQTLANTFIGVDFKEFVRLIHKNVGGGSGTAFGARPSKFFDAVRLRETTPEISSAVDDAVANLTEYNASTPMYDWGLSNPDMSELYAKTLTDLVRKVLPDEEKKDEDKKQEENKQDQSQQGNDGEGDSEQQDTSDKPEGDESEDGKGKSDGDPDGDDKSEGKGKQEGRNGNSGASEGNKTEGGESEAGKGSCEKGGNPEAQTPKDLGLPTDFLKDVAKQMFVQPPAEVTSVLNRFASRLSKRKGAQAAGCWSALHGRINTRRDATDKDRIFRRKSDVGERLNSSVNLTLWVDVSGSFEESEGALNQILAATAKAMNMSGGKLDVNVVKMGMGAKLAPKGGWCIKTGGGNTIDITYHDAWKQTRRKDRRNIDIVVFDGDAKSNIGYSYHEGVPTEMPNGKAIESVIWDHPDCHIVTDEYNKRYFGRMTKAHVTYMEEGYAEQLQAEVIKILDRIL